LSLFFLSLQSDVAEAAETLIDRGKNALLDTGRGLADRSKDAMVRGKDAVARGVARGVDASSEALQAAFEKLSGPAQFFFTYIFDQTAGTQLTRCLMFTFGLQLLAGFVPHAFFGKERHYHMLGGANFIILTLYTLFTQPDWGLRKLIVSGMVCTWAARLMTYLYRRDGNTVDKRFASIRNRPALKLVYWLGQAAWVSACMLPVILMNSEDTPQNSFALPGKTLPRTVHTPLGDVNLPAFLGSIRGPARRGLWGRFSWHNLTALDYIGFAVWAAGFAMETVADWQKEQFHKRIGAAQRPAAEPAQQQGGQRQAQEGQRQGQGQGQAADAADGAPKFLRTGLWQFSRHPNYFGEIMVWCGIYLSCFSALSGWQHIAAILSPLATVLTITTLTGIPYSEDGKERQFGALPAYQEYKQKTPLLVPGLF
jgi:steroid 5-alpha reductase family enzyme